MIYLGEAGGTSEPSRATPGSLMIENGLACHSKNFTRRGSDPDMTTPRMRRTHV